MSDYAQWETALKNWAIAATGLVWVWENEPRQHMIHPYGILSGPHTSDTVGVDWIHQTQTEVSSGVFTVQPQPRGVRVATYKARVITRSQSSDLKAGRYLELARMALRLPEVKAAWVAVEMSLAKASTIQIFDAPGINDRVESIASLTLTVNQVPHDVPAGADQGWLERVQVSSSLTPLGTPPNLNEEFIPPED